MGRRAADLTTPVPVLGVPATVGVRSWKTIGGDRSGGALLQTWGQCTIGIQTSPGISRPSIQLPDSLSNNITQTTDSCITKETKAVPLHIKNDKEKKAISRLKTEETKIKKEVTFKAFGGVASNDVAGCQKRSCGTYCYARAIKTNPLIASTASSSSRLKPSSRYINGSVVDSEAIGGISVVNDDTESVTAVNSHKRDLHCPYTDQSGKMQSLSLAMVRKIYNYGGEKQSGMSRGPILGQESCMSDTIFGEKPSNPALTTLFTASHTLPQILKKNRLNSLTSAVKKTQTHNHHLLYLNKEVKCRQKPHPACPVHSRGSLATVFHAHASSDITSMKAETTLNAKALIVAEAINKSKDCTINCVTNSMQHNKIPLLTLTPLMATAIKTFQTSPKSLQTAPHNSHLDNIPQNVSVSVHNAPKSPPLSLNTVATGTERASSAVTEKTFNLETSTNSTLRTLQEALNSTQKEQIFKSEPSSNLTLGSFPPDLYRCKEKPTIRAANKSPVKRSFIDNAAQFPASVNPPQEPALHSSVSAAVPKITSNHEVNPDQITCKSSTDKAVASQIHSAQLTFSNSNPALHISASSSHKIPSVSKSPDSGSESPLALYSNTASHCTEYKNTAYRSNKTKLKKTNFQTSSLLTPSREMRGIAAASSTSLLKLTQTSEVVWNNKIQDENKAHPTQEPDIKSQDSIKPCVQVVIPKQQSDSLTTLLTSSKSQNMSEIINRSSDAKSYHANPPMSPTVELHFDENKFRDNIINKFVVHECKERVNLECSQITNHQNCFSPIKPSTFHLWGNPDREQQTQHYQGYIQTEGHNATSPPGQKTRQHFALSAADSNEHVKCESNLDRQKHPSYSSPSVIAQANCECTFSLTNKQVKPITQSTDCQVSHFDITLQRQHYTSPERVPASFTAKGGLPIHTAPEWELPSKSSLPLQSKEVEAIRRLDLKFSPRARQSSPGGSNLFHSHPSDVTLLLPPSPQCCSSAGLEQRLKTVEDSLLANKDRITTLLNIIQDLETCNAPNSLLRCCKSGLDLKNCSTCQKTACIVYSVEYDFRQQERHFLEVLNFSQAESNSFSAHQAEPSNLGLLRNVIFKNFTKTKLKSKKLCKTLLKWIPRKLHQL